MAINFPGNPVLDQEHTDADGVKWLCHKSIADGDTYDSWTRDPEDGIGRPHASTTGQTTDDHHNKSHAHDGEDGSGTVDYTDLTSIPESFPPAGHNLTDHLDLPVTTPTGQFLRDDGTWAEVGGLPPGGDTGDALVKVSAEDDDVGWESPGDFISSADLTRAIGNINNPLFHMPLLQNMAMKHGDGESRFERASTATYIDRYGILRYAGVDEERFEWQGLLMEGDSTNMALTSETMTTNWYHGRSFLHATDTTTAPDGIGVAHKLTNDTQTNSHYIRIQAILSTDVDFTGSLFVKAGEVTSIIFHTYRNNPLTAGPTTTLNLLDGTYTTSDDTVKVIPMANGWFRISTSANVGSTDDTFDFMHIQAVDGLDNNEDGFYIWGGQMESTPFATSYIPTTDTSVTRTDDDAYIVAEGNLSNDNFTVVFDYYTGVVRSVNSNPIISFSDVVYKCDIRRWGSGDNIILYYYNGQSNQSPGSATSDGVTRNRVGMSYDGTNLVRFNNNGNNSYAIDYHKFSITDIIISGNTACPYHIANLRTYDFAMTDAERNLL